MQHTTDLIDVPDEAVDDVISSFEAEGYLVQLEKIKDGLWAIHATQEEYTVAATTILEEEVRSLVRFAIEYGHKQDDDMCSRLVWLLNEIDSNKNPRKKSDYLAELVTLYSKLSQMIYDEYGVNARTIIASENYKGYLRPAFILAAMFFFVAIAESFIEQFVLNVGQLDTSIPLWIRNYYDSGMNLVSPFLWGGVGAFVYLLKRLSDYAAESKFDPVLLPGLFSNVLFGALLGCLVIYLVSGIVESEPSKLESSALAFLSGFLSRTAYSKLEHIIEKFTRSKALRSER